MSTWIEITQQILMVTIAAMCGGVLWINRTHQMQKHPKPANLKINYKYASVAMLLVSLIVFAGCMPM